jgi:hypothetical protein
VVLVVALLVAVVFGDAAGAGAAEGPAIEIAAADATTDCGALDDYVDDIDGISLDADGLRPGWVATRHVCLRNRGDDAVAVAVGLGSVESVETRCTGDEPLVDPDGPTCGHTGELHTAVAMTVAVGVQQQCDVAAAPAVRFDAVVDRPATAPLVRLAPGAVTCAAIDVVYPLLTPRLDVLANQTDRVRWRVRFAATEAAAPTIADHQGGAPGDDEAGGDLPRTGGDLRLLVVTGAALLAIGSALRRWAMARDVRAGSRRVVAGLPGGRNVEVGPAEAAGQLRTTSQEGTT